MVCEGHKKGLKISSLYFNGEAGVAVEPGIPMFEPREAKTKVKTRTRNFVRYLATQFADRYEFFMEARYEGHDVVTVGDRNKFKNFEIHIDYVMNQVLMFGTVVCRTMTEVEKFLGKVVAKQSKSSPAWANNKTLKVKKQVERLMSKKNQQKSRMKDNEVRSRPMVFTMTPM